MAISEKLTAAIPKKTIEVDDPPEALIVEDKDWDDLLVSLSTEERLFVDQGKMIARFNNIPVFRKSKVLEIV